MGSEILCQFLLGNNEGIFERPRKIVWTERMNRINVNSCLKIFQKSEKLWIMIAVSEYRLINCVSIFLREGLPTLRKVSKFIWPVNKQGFYVLFSSTEKLLEKTIL